jgi:prepilin peptidase CpaA
VKLPIEEGMVALALIAGWTDFRSRRIPNWLTIPAFVLGIAAKSFFFGWSGLKMSLFGTVLGLGLLMPFVLLRSLGDGDWKLAAALGAFTGPGLLIDLLLWSFFIAGMMASMLIISKGRLRETLHNIGHILVSLVTFKLPDHRVSLDNSESLKIPYGVALAFSVFLYGLAHFRADHALLIGSLAGTLLIGLIEGLKELKTRFSGRNALSADSHQNRGTRP